MTIELKLLRYSGGDESTLGLLHRVSGSAYSFRCFTLEDQFNEPKVKGETRVPPGRYEIKLRTEDSPLTKKYRERFPWFKGHLWLQDVPDFTFVYIHVGNDDDDTDGCILVGDGAQSNVEDEGKVLSSVVAYRRLYEEIHDALEGVERVFITIEDYA